jgi:hypothetical protein
MPPRQIVPISFRELSRIDLLRPKSRSAKHRSAQAMLGQGWSVAFDSIFEPGHEQVGG